MSIPRLFWNSYPLVTQYAFSRTARGCWYLLKWLPYYADRIGAPPPRHVPAWLARLAVGSYGVLMMLEQRGASNRLARETLGWAPSFGSWRQGFETLVGSA